MPEERLVFATRSGQVEEGEIQVRRARGRERLAQPYEYELELEVDRDGGLGTAAIEDLLRSACAIRFGEVQVHGVLRSIRMLSTAQPQPIAYRATLVPRVSTLGLTQRSRVFQALDVAGILKAVLAEHGLRAQTDFELRLHTRYPVSEYVVQYQESDLDFLQRLVEHHGIFYAFEQTDDGERIVFADANSEIAPLEGSETIEYTAVDAATPGIREITREITPQPTGVLLREYNWRTPSVPLESQAEVDKTTGRGFLNLYGEHFKTPAEGDAIAKVRAQEALVSRDVLRGACRIAALRPGHRFALHGHPCGELDAEYAVTAIEIELDGRAATDGGGASCDLRFTAIPYSVAYRPPCEVAWPRIVGVMHARVDGEVPGTAAPIDEYGRYKILFPFDLAGQPGGKASRWVRLAQPASGPGFGIHFPLHIGVEVAVAHVDGDPDRPIILSSPPNTETVTPVNASNATQSQIVTKTGIRMTWDDDCPPVSES